MGEARTEVTLVNIRDTVRAEEGLVPETEVRQLTVNAVVNSEKAHAVPGSMSRAMDFGAGETQQQWEKL
jgi:hypothetical protein